MRALALFVLLSIETPESVQSLVAKKHVLNEGMKRKLTVTHPDSVTGRPIAFAIGKIWPKEIITEKKTKE